VTGLRPTPQYDLFCINPTHSLTAVDTLFWVTKISHYLAYLHWIPQKLRSVFTVVGMFKSEALIFFWIFWVYVVRRFGYFEVKSLHHLLQLIIVTLLSNCNRTNTITLYVIDYFFTIPNSAWMRLQNSYYHEFQLFDWSKLLPPRPVFKGGFNPHRKFLGLPFCGNVEHVQLNNVTVTC